MIKHIVLWKLAAQAEGADKQENALTIKRILEDLKGKVPEILRIEVGIDFSKSDASYDVALYSEFASRADLDAYQNHPLHKKAAEFVGKVRTERVVVDYET